jgi:hypothetical protein
MTERQQPSMVVDGGREDKITGDGGKTDGGSLAKKNAF